MVATASWLDFYFLPYPPAGDIPFLSARENTAITTFQRCGAARTIEWNRFPEKHARGNRVIRFKATIENALHGAYSIEARLYDVTHDVLIASSLVTNSGEVDKGKSVEFSSAALTVGTTSGTLRSDLPNTLYEVQFRAVGSLTPPVDQVIVSGARLDVSYEA